MLTSARALLALAAILVVATAACGSTPSGAGSSGTTSSTGGVPTASPTPVPTTGTPSLPSVAPSVVPTSDLADVPLPPGVMQRPAVRAAVEDAATRRKVSPDQVVGAVFVPVTWNDGSLGCPQKDMSYTQATVEGELLVLRVDGALMQYHGRVGGPYTYCAAPSAGYSVDS